MVWKQRGSATQVEFEKLGGYEPAGTSRSEIELMQ
jgi:hypothetical protein